jgi:branched-chain amino acid transport system permease protein
MLETAVISSDVNTSSAKFDAILFLVVLGALLFQRQGRTARGDESSTWQAARNVRPIPRELISLPEVRWGMRGAGALLATFLLTLPLFLSEARVSLAATIAIICIVTVSLVVLTGWAGQVSLGQVAFMGIGAAVGSWLTVTWDWDLAVVILASGLVGAVAAMLIGLPALRIKGLFLAVATLAFAVAVSSYGLNKAYVTWLPTDRVPRNAILGRIAVDTETRYYYLCLVCLLGAVLIVRGIRNSRTGRVLIGVRDNERGAQAFGVNVIGAKLTAFGVSGFLAAAAGALFVHSQQSLGIQPYTPARSFQVFILVVIGGLGSIPGALLGPVFIEGLEYFRSLFPETIRNIMFFLTTGVGLILILMFLPGGFGQVYYSTRDRILRAIARRRGLVVPSLLADVGDAPEAPPEPLEPLEEATAADAPLLDLPAPAGLPGR